MPAAVDSMFFVGETPWHGLGTKIDDASRLDPKEARKQAGLEWYVDTKPLFTADGQRAPAQAIYRTDTGAILGVSGERYRPYQNEHMAEWFRPFIESEEAFFHTGGSLMEGAKTWFLCQMNRNNSTIVEGDDVAKFILLSNAHDGKVAIRVGFTPIRVVCANTLAMAHGDEASKLLRVKHTRNTQKNLETIRDAMDLANQAFEMTAEKFRFLASRSVNKADLEKYVKIIVGVETKGDDDISTRTKNTMATIVNLIENGRGNTAKNVSGTWWAAYNGATEWLNHERGRNNNNRLNSLWFGVNAGVNRKALDAALTLAS